MLVGMPVAGRGINAILCCVAVHRADVLVAWSLSVGGKCFISFPLLSNSAIQRGMGILSLITLNILFLYTVRWKRGILMILCQNSVADL